MKTFLIALAAIFVAAWIAAMFSPHAGLRRIARMVMFLFSLVFCGIAVVCFVFPFFTPHGSGAFVMIFPGFIALFFAYISFSFWLGAREYGAVAGLPDSEKLKWMEGKNEAMSAELQQKIARDEEELAKIRFNPLRRKKLKQRIGENKFLLQSMSAMTKSYKDHVEEKLTD